MKDVERNKRLIEDYEEAIEELGDEDRNAINAWLKAVENEVHRIWEENNGKYTVTKAGFGRAAAIELLHLRLSVNLE